MKIYLIRHGETEWNVLRRLQGRADIDLNENGRSLARVTGKALVKVDFSRIFSSPLKRAYETAQIIRGNRPVDIVVDERIQEISFGIFEGLCCGKENYNIPDIHFNNFFDHPECYTPPEGGETITDLCTRTTAFLHDIVNNEEYKDETILISTHGAALMGILSSVHQCDIAHFWNGGVHKNCAVTILSVQNGRITIEEENKVFQ